MGDVKEIVTLETLQEALEKQRNEMRNEMLEDLKQTQLELMERQRDMNRDLMEGMVSNFGQMLQNIFGVVRPSIEGPKITEVKEMPVEKKEKDKPKIKSHVSVTNNPFLSKAQSSQYNAYARLTEATQKVFTQEEFHAIPDMTPGKTKEKVKKVDKPHPNWVQVGATSAPYTRESTPEDGEILEYEERWNSPEGEGRRRVRNSRQVSKTSHNIKNKIELKENELESLINKTISEKVNSTFGERNRLNENVITNNNLTDKIQVEVTENISGTNRVYKN